jgi:hypothetical protein
MWYPANTIPVPANDLFLLKVFYSQISQTMLAAEKTVNHIPSVSRARMQAATSLDMKYASLTQAETMADIQKLFQVSDTQLLELIKRMGEEMLVGLASDDASDLKMIPSFVTGTTH